MGTRYPQILRMIEHPGRGKRCELMKIKRQIRKIFNGRFRPLRRSVPLLLCVLVFLTSGNCFIAASAEESPDEVYTAQPPAVTAELDRQQLSPEDAGSTVKMTVRMDGPAAIHAMGFRIDWDPEVLTPEKVEGDGADLVITDEDVNYEKGIVSWQFDEEAVTAETLAVITFRVQDGIAAGSYTLGISGLRLSDDWGMTAFADGESASAVLTVTDQPVFAAQSLILSGQIGVNVFMRLPEGGDEDYSDSYMEFTVSGEKQLVNFDPAKKNTTGDYYGFTCYINSIQMADSISAVYHYGDGLTIEDEFSVLDYTNYIRDHAADFDENTLELVYALVDYGHYAQPFLAENAGWTPGIDHAVMPAARELTEEDVLEAKTALADYSLQYQRKGAQITDLKVSLSLDTETAVYLYFRTGAGYQGEPSARIDGAEENTAVLQTDGRYRVQIGNIPAHQLGIAREVEIEAGETAQIRISALSYAAALVSSEIYSEDMTALQAMTALCRYYQAARAYLAVSAESVRMAAGDVSVSSLQISLDTEALLTGERSDSTVWNGTDADISWYLQDPDASLYRIATAAQLAGAAALVNGLVNENCRVFVSDTQYYPASWWNDTANGFTLSEGEEEREGSQNLSTELYHYGIESFKDKTIRLTSDLDMGGTQDADGDWSGPLYMPLGGQYLMTPDDSLTKLSSSFCGTFDGNGHYVRNIYCSRRCTTGNYGDGQSIGFIGRLGVHDSDDASLRPTEPTVKNLAITGYIYGNRSIGGIVGKTGKTTANSGDGSGGAMIRNCVNYATVSNTDAKGCGGICGAFWNGGVMENCINAGNVSTTYACPTGGLAGSNENAIRNSYSIGTVTATSASYAMAIGTNNGGAPIKVIVNCWYLDGSSLGGGYYSQRKADNSGAMSASDMKTAQFAATLGDAFAADTVMINQGYPVLKWQLGGTAGPEVMDYTAQAAEENRAEAAYDAQTETLTVSCAKACAVISIDWKGSCSALTPTQSGTEGTFVFQTGNLSIDDRAAIALKGDVDLTGSVDESDVAAVKAVSLERQTLDSLNSLLADVNQDGLTDALDAAAIRAAARGSLVLNW